MEFLWEGRISEKGEEASQMEKEKKGMGEGRKQEGRLLSIRC